ncbi:MAG TPA: type I-B CRISPR-associated protein Cas8b1/Cst1 [Pyrinomonadaceae bacterium]
MPNNWLYNAGLIGLLRILQAKGVNILERLNDNGFELVIDDFNGFADAYCKVALQVSAGRFIPWGKQEERKLLDGFGANYTEVHNTHLERLRQELSITDTVEQSEQSVRIAVNAFVIEVKQRVEQGLETQREQLAQSTPQNKVEQKELDKRRKSLERDGARAIKIAEEIRNTTGLLEKQKYIVDVLQRFYFNKGVIANYSLAKDKTRVRQFEEKYVVPARNLVGTSNPQAAIPCRFCGRLPVNLDERWKEDSVFNEGMFSVSGVSVKYFKNFFYNLIPDIFICDVCELILLCAWTGFNQIPWQLRSGNEDTEYIFVNLPSLPLLFEQNNRVNTAYQRNLLSLRDTIYEDVMADLFSERKQRGQWVLQNVLFVEIRPAGRKPGTIFKYFQIGKDVAKLFTESESAKSFRLIRGKVAAPGDKKGSPSLQLKREVVKRFLAGDQVYDLAYQVCRQSVDANMAQAKTVLEMICLHGVRQQIWKKYAVNYKNCELKIHEGEAMESKQVYGILRGLYNVGASLGKPMEMEKRQRLAYRLMAVVRSGKSSEFYDMLMKLCIDSKRPVPATLLGLLNPMDAIEFESKAYAVLSGFLGESRSVTTGEGTNAASPEEIPEISIEEESNG